MQGEDGSLDFVKLRDGMRATEYGSKEREFAGLRLSKTSGIV